jgi:hypothetical protein
MTISKLQIKPGIHKEGTSYSEEGSWYDCDKVRFRAGKPEKIGGWERVGSQNFKGVARVMMNWTLLDSSDCIAFGTNKKFYIEKSGVFYDVTPIRFTDVKIDPITTGAAGTNVHTYTTSIAHSSGVGDFFTLSGITTDVDGICTDTYTDPFATTAAASALVAVNTTTPHYAVAGDTVTFSGTTGFDGIPSGDFNTSFSILEVTSPTSYFIEVATTATLGLVTGGGTVTAVYLSRLNREFEVLSVPTSTTLTFATDTDCITGGVTGGGTVTAAFQVSIGYSINITGGGWGTGTWSRGAWGTPITSSLSGISMRLWSVDNYGQDLIFCTRDGAMYRWDASAGFTTRGALISDEVGASDVPAQTSIVRVTDERHVLAIGATDRTTTTFDPLLIRWSDQEDYTNWTPAVDNTSGDQRIPMGSYVMAAIIARQETLIWTDHSLHSLQFIGPPYTFGLQTIAENTNIVGPNAAVNVNNVTYWMGKDRFWVYSGRVQTLDCTVQRHIFGRLNTDQAAQVYASVNDSFTEVTWFYCSIGSNSVDSYVTYNYGDNLWTYGNLDRTAWVDCPGRGGLPYAMAGGYDADDGCMYVHEVGYDDGSTNPPSPIVAYVESADFDIQDGDRLMFVDRLIPDITFSRSTVGAPSLIFTVESKKYPGQYIQGTDNRTVTKTVTSTITDYTQQVWVRLRGRQMRVKVSSDGVGVCWLLGSIRANIRPDGKQ